MFSIKIGSAKKQIDFADMINDAEKMLLEIKECDYKPSYKYIIIDEFQDLARQRFNPTKSLVDAPCYSPPK